MMLAGPMLLVTATAMAALPVAPALLEVRHRTDAAPIPLQQHDANTLNFAKSFRRYIEPMLPALDDCQRRQACETLPMPGATAVLLAGSDSRQARELIHAHGGMGAVVLCARPLTVESGSIFTGDTYVQGVLVTESGCILRSALAEEDLELGSGSRVMRWLHSEANLLVHAGCTLYGRASAAKNIYLAPGCRFERVRARQIVASATDSELAIVIPFLRELRTPARAARLRSQSTVTVGPNETFEGDLVCEQDVVVGAHCRVNGSLKSHGVMTIGDGATINGSVVSGGEIAIGCGCLVRGPVIAEGKVTIARGAQIGSLVSPTTVTAKQINLTSGACVCGSMWARADGVTGS